MKHLASKTLRGFVVLLAILGTSVFGAAGTFGFWQAWVYLAVFALCTVVITTYLFCYDQRLLANRVKAGPTAERQKPQQLIQLLASVAFIGMLVVPGLDHRYHWSAVPTGWAVSSAALVALGFAAVFWVFRENSFASATIEVVEDQRVITTGPYRIVRHPMYAGAGVLVLATPVALGSWVGVACSIVLLGVMVVRLTEEEQYLDEHLAGYKDYRQRVKYRLIPGVW